MTQAVERLLALARLDAGVDRLRPRPFDAAELAEQCAALVRPLAEARGLTLAVHRAGPAPITADHDKLREIVTNLLHNAVEYNRPHGAIDLTVARENGRLEVAVKDSGVGIGSEAKRTCSSASSGPTRPEPATGCTPASAWPSSRATSI